MDRKQHWEDVYGKKLSHEVSWYQAEPTLSLSLVSDAAGAGAASIIDVGGGASTLVDRLIDRPRTEITVLDLAGAALRVARERLGSRATQVTWLEGDILNLELPKAA